MLKNLKITTKLVAILVAPVMVLILLTVVGVKARQSEASDAQRVQELTRFAGEAGSLIREIELEGLYSASVSGSRGERGKPELERQKARTDAAIARFHEQESAIEPARGSEAIRGAVNQVQARISKLAVERNAAADFSKDGVAIADSYGTFAGNVSSLIGAVADAVDNPQAARGMANYADLVAIGIPEAAAAQRIVVAAEAGFFPSVLPRGPEVQADRRALNAGCADNASAGQASCAIYSEIVSFDAAAAAQAKRFDDSATPEVSRTYRAEALDGTFANLVTEAIKGGKDQNTLAAVPASTFVAAAASRIDKLAAVGTKILLDRNNANSVFSLATARADKAQTESSFYFFGALGTMLLAALVTFSVARSITVPLRKLTAAAYSLSTERLPALVERLRNPEEESHESLAASLTPIDIHSKDEIGQLADSFNSIQQVTIEVAEEQSVLLRKGIGDIFINLARRNQTLLDRQIEFIDQLEANEEDPDQLDNLFKLDHLATRMRRNAESLLVLAGAEPPRRRGRPVSLADVVRVAIGEVEDFARIQLLALDDATVGGNVAVDLAHLLSELMENATHFSPPDTMVEIVGHRSEAGYIISVSDQGIGMSAEQIGESNHQLARPPLVGLALSRSLGFIVIGRLAQRFDITVKLTASPSGGVTALVTLPADLVTYENEQLPPTTRAALPHGSAPALPEGPTDDIVVLDDRPAVEPYTQPAAAPRQDFEHERAEYERAEYERAERERAEYERAGYEPIGDYAPGGDYSPSGDYATGDDYDSGLSESAEFERGLQQILGDDRSDDRAEDRAEDRGPVAFRPPVDTPPPAVPPPAVRRIPDPPVAQPTTEAPAVHRVPDPPAGRPASEAPAPSPSEAPEPRPARVRAAPILTVAEQIAAASRAEAKVADTTAAGLVRRTPKQRADGAVGGGMMNQPAPRATTSTQRSPEEVRKMLSRYRSGLNKGRNSVDPEKTDS